MVYLAGTYSSAAAGRLADRIGRYQVLWAAVLITAGGVLLTLPAWLPAIGAGMIVMTAGFFAAHSVASGWVGARARVAPAQASALYLCLYYIGSSIAGSAGGVFYARAAWPGTVIFVLALIALACSLTTTARAESFAKRIEIGGGRMMYIECQGSGSPTVVLMSGAGAASDLWHAADQKGPTVYDDIQKTTRVCAYDRPGAPHLDQTLSRSDPVPQPTSAQDGVDDLVALLKAAPVPGPYVLVAHS